MEVAQRISNGFVMGEQSEYSAYIRELIKAGLTEAEANAEAFKEFFIKNPLKQEHLITDFYTGLWNAVIETMTIYSKEHIVFKFKGGTEIKWSIV